jgi:hypothetical protein
MNYEEFFPLSTPAKLSTTTSNSNDLIASMEDVKFLRSWLVYDSKIQSNLASGRSNRDIALGLALAAGISACFWAGIAFLVARIWN